MSGEEGPKIKKTKPVSMAVLMAAASRRGDEESMREVLQYLAIRRQQHEHQRCRLAADVRAAIGKASGAGIPMTEIAGLLRMDRSSMYKTYLASDDDNAD